MGEQREGLKFNPKPKPKPKPKHAREIY